MHLVSHYVVHHQSLRLDDLGAVSQAERAFQQNRLQTHRTNINTFRRERHWSAAFQCCLVCGPNRTLAKPFVVGLNCDFVFMPQQPRCDTQPINQVNTKRTQRFYGLGPNLPWEQEQLSTPE